MDEATAQIVAMGEEGWCFLPGVYSTRESVPGEGATSVVDGLAQQPPERPQHGFFLLLREVNRVFRRLNELVDVYGRGGAAQWWFKQCLDGHDQQDQAGVPGGLKKRRVEQVVRDALMLGEESGR